MGAAILSISLELCKLLPFLSACELNVQTFFFFNFFPGKPVEERVKEMGQSKTQLGRWGRGLGRRHLLFLEGQPLLGAWAGDVQQDTRCAGCCPGTHLAPTRAPLASSCRRKKPHALFKGLWMMLGRAVPAPWGPGKVLARGRWRWQHGGSCPHAGAAGARAGWAGELLVLLPAMLVSGEKALFSSCHSATFQRLSLRLLPPPRSQMCAVRGPENSPYLGRELQHPPKLPAPTPRGC